VLLDIYCVFISQILRDLNIKNSSFVLPTMFSANLFCLGEKSSKGNILFFKREYFVTNIIFSKKHFFKNHKLNFKEI